MKDKTKPKELWIGCDQRADDRIHGVTIHEKPARPAPGRKMLRVQVVEVIEG